MIVNFGYLWFDNLDADVELVGSGCAVLAVYLAYKWYRRKRKKRRYRRHRERESG